MLRMNAQMRVSGTAIAPEYNEYMAVMGKITSGDDSQGLIILRKVTHATASPRMLAALTELHVAY